MKKVIVLISTIVLLTLAFAMSASAEYIIYEDFSDGIDCFQDLVTPGDEGVIREWVDGTFHGANPARQPVLNQRIYCPESTLAPNFTASFDYKLDASCGGDRGPVVNIYLGGSRASLNPTPTFMDVGGTRYSELAAKYEVWYTTVLKFKSVNGNAVYDVYRRERDSEEPFKKYLSDIPVNAPYADAAQFQVYLNWGADAYFDNIKYYSGTFPKEAFFELDGADVQSSADIKGGILTAKTTIVSDKFIVDSDNLVVDCEVTPVLVIYNKNNRMISCTTAPGENLKIGENEIEVSVDTSAFADKLDGGYVGFYLIDDFNNLQVIAPKIEL